MILSTLQTIHSTYTFLISHFYKIPNFYNASELKKTNKQVSQKWTCPWMSEDFIGQFVSTNHGSLMLLTSLYYSMKCAFVVWGGVVCFLFVFLTKSCQKWVALCFFKRMAWHCVKIVGPHEFTKNRWSPSVLSLPFSSNRYKKGDFCTDKKLQLTMEGAEPHTLWKS